jgi:glyoxylase-like metal-dependent hydrolase (beta-lactamase superfamily II)
MLGVNAYIINGGQSAEAAVIDPGADADRIIAAAERKDLTLTHILLTHGHFDHVGAIDGLRARFGSRVIMHAGDAEMLTDPAPGLEPIYGYERVGKGADVFVNGGDVLRLAGLEIQVMSTPGHSPGGVCYIVEWNIFSGDTLFQGSIGRTDFSGGSPDDMRMSLKRLRELDGDYTVYPGHGPATRLEAERRANPYMVD